MAGTRVGVSLANVFSKDIACICPLNMRSSTAYEA